MTYAEFKAEYFTPANIAEFATQQDSMVWVSDLTGRSIDSRFVAQLTADFDNTIAQ